MKDDQACFRTRQRRRRAVKLAIGLLLAAWVGSVAFSAVNEGAVPPVSEFGTIPAPSRAGEISQFCGSGGCWWEMDVEIESPQTARSLVADLELASERCEPVNLWTLRKTCIGRAEGKGGLRIYLRSDFLLSKY